MTRPGSRLPKAILTALRSHQRIAGQRKAPPEVTEWDENMLTLCSYCGTYPADMPSGMCPTCDGDAEPGER